jgi:ubiquinol-cytochrome c reductase cytochrome c1 subunit
MRSRTSLIMAALVLVGLAGGSRAAEEEVEPIDKSWPTDGPLGSFDRLALQRGFQVYREVCSGCHGVTYLAFRNLAELGFSEEEVTAIAAEYLVTDGPNENGEMFERPARPSDHLPPPFPNEAAARVANAGALPPDLSLITKARGGGMDYLYSLLVGYEDPPAGVEVPEGLYYNLYFPGHFIAMPPPIYPDGVVYADGTPATVAQQASDVTQFLHFVAEPKLEERKQTGLRAMLFLITLAGVLYAYKRKVWRDLH